MTATLPQWHAIRSDKGDGWRTHRKEGLLRSTDIRPLLGDLVCLLHMLVEDVEGDGNKGRVRDPGPIMPVLHLPQLVCLDLYTGACQHAGLLLGKQAGSPMSIPRMVK